MESGPRSKHDAKPKELSKDSLGWNDVEELDQPHDTSKLFTKLRFGDVGLKGHLADVIQAEPSKGGFGLSMCTAVQSMTLPLFVNPSSSCGKSVLIKSQTGSGKTLSYVLPVLHDLLSLDPPLQRGDGCRALIIAPTRELCAQISDVVTNLTKCCVHIVGGSIVGGEKKKSEKARLRKGVVVLVGTPGRLLDHLRLTESFTLRKLRFIVLDEIDRLLDMGFEQNVLEILSRLRGEALPGLKDASLGINHSSGDSLTQRWAMQKALEAKRCADPSQLHYIMASATLTAAVRKLAWPILSSPSLGRRQSLLLIDGDHEAVKEILSEQELEDCAVYQPKELDLSQGQVVATPLGIIPTGLQQYYMLISAKWRLPALCSFLHLRRKQKVIVFFSTCDSVDIHALLFRHMQWPQGLDAKGAYEASPQNDGKAGKAGKGKPGTSATNRGAAKGSYKHSGAVQAHEIDPLESEFTGLFGDVPLYRLHGKLPQEARKQTFSRFSQASRGILLATDVAARGLDLQAVDWILQYDAPCDTLDYVHRIGRTARRGQAGKAMLFLYPSESMYVTLLASHGLMLDKASSTSMLNEASRDIPGAKKFKNLDEMVAVILQRRAENTLYENHLLVQAATQAYRSYIRAYSTHTADAKGIFKVKDLHLGHVAKAFGLRDKPSELEAKEDIIARIFNGDFMAKDSKVRQAREAKERARLLVAQARASSASRLQEERAESSDQEDSAKLGKRARDASEEDAEEESEDVDELEGAEEEEEEEEVEGNGNAPSSHPDEEEEEGGDGEGDLPIQHSAADLASSHVKLQRGLKKQRARQLVSRVKSQQKGLRRTVPQASGKHRSAGGYFRKKLRSEFSA